MSEEPGYSEEELRRGEDQAWHIPVWGCLLTTGIVALLLYLMFANGFFMHGD